jgi:hypothetical protein
VVYLCGSASGDLCERPLPDGSTRVLGRAPEPGIIGPLYASPSLPLRGDLLAFVFGRMAYVAHDGVRNRRALTGDRYTDAIAARKDGKQFLLGIPHERCMTPGNLCFGGHELRIVGAGGTELARIDADAVSATWLGLARVAFAAPAIDSSKIRVASTRSPSSPMTLISHPGWQFIDVAGSPDGRLLAVSVSFNIRDESVIGLVDVQRKSLRFLTKGPSDVAPAWCPDNRTLVFVRGGRPPGETQARGGRLLRIDVHTKKIIPLGARGSSPACGPAQ